MRRVVGRMQWPLRPMLPVATLSATKAEHLEEYIIAHDQPVSKGPGNDAELHLIQRRANLVQALGVNEHPAILAASSFLHPSTIYHLAVISALHDDL